MPDLLRLPRVKERTGLARTTIYKMVAAGTFPAPIKIGAGTTVWVSSEIDAWIQARIEQARSAVSSPAKKSRRSSG